jgi:dipeptidyl aminopeptidase/acylaminoacyl peptidase
MTNPELDLNSNVFFIGYRQNKTIELWNSTLQNNSQVPVYVEPAHYPFYALPREEQFFLGNCNWTRECNIPLNDMPSQYSWGPLHVSPKKDMLAWTETAEFCPPQLGYCDGGVTRIIIWEVNQLEKKMVLEIPYHIDLLSRQNIFSLDWSPDNQDIGFIRSSKELGWSRLEILNIISSSAADIGDNVLDYKWSPNGDRIALVIQISSGQKLQVVNKSGNLIYDMNENFRQITDFSWSPNNQQLVIAAVDMQGHSGIYIVDSQYKKNWSLLGPSSDLLYYAARWTKQGTKIAIVRSPTSQQTAQLLVTDILNPSNIQIMQSNSSVYVNPTNQSVKLEWSPDGKIIAVNMESKGNTTSTGIDFFDPYKNVIVSRFDQNNFPIDWSFSENGNAILVYIQNQATECSNKNISKLGLFYWSKNTFDEIGVVPLLSNDLKNCDLSITSVVLGGLSQLQRPQP